MYRVDDDMRIVALVALVIALAGCSSTAAPSASTAAPAGSASLTPSTLPSVAPSPSAPIVKIPPIANAPDSKKTVSLIAAHTRWNPNTLTAPAGKVWHVKIDSQDTISVHHNFTVASGKRFEERIYQATNFAKGTYTFDIPGLPAGNYLFICTIHPDSMTGTLTLE